MLPVWMKTEFASTSAGCVTLGGFVTNRRWVQIGLLACPELRAPSWLTNPPATEGAISGFDNLMGAGQLRDQLCSEDSFATWIRQLPE